MAGEEKQSLLTSGNRINSSEESDRDHGVYYDSFPRCIPSPDYSNQANPNGTDKGKKESIEDIKVYKRRWYIVVIFSMYGFCQNFIWNNWGPISASAEDVFGWHDSTIAWMSNWGPIAYILSGLLFPWLMQVKGLRWAVLSSMFFVALGSTARIFTSDPATATILIHVGQFLNGLGGPVAMGGIPLLSATWFTSSERVTATALGTCIETLGSALSFIVGPLLVSDHSPHSNGTTNSTTITPLFGPYLRLHGTGVSDPYVQEMKSEIMRFMYYCCGGSWFIFLAILIYFPAKPPQPPALSATTGREAYWVGMRSLLRKPAFLVVAFTYGISLGVINCWTSVLDVNLKPFGIGQTEAGQIGFYSVLGACAMSLLVGRFADYFIRFLKLFIVILYLVGTGALVTFALMLIKVIPFSHALLYTTVIVATTAINAAIPLLFELACELAYPTSEGAANGVLTYLNNIAGLIFLAVFSVPHIGTMWMNWTVIGSTVVCIPLIGFLKGRFWRLEVDQQIRPEMIADQEIVVSCEDNNSVNC